MNIELILLISTISVATSIILVCIVYMYCKDDYTHIQNATITGDIIQVINNISLENAIMYCRKYCYEKFIYTDAGDMIIIRGNVIESLWQKEKSGVYIL